MDDDGEGDDNHIEDDDDDNYYDDDDDDCNDDDDDDNDDLDGVKSSRLRPSTAPPKIIGKKLHFSKRRKRKNKDRRVSDAASEEV